MVIRWNHSPRSVHCEHLLRGFSWEELVFFREQTDNSSHYSLMKQNIIKLLLATLLGLLPVTLVAATQSKAAAAAEQSRVQITFEHPENFTDVKDSQMSSDKVRDAILEEIREFIAETALRTMPKDATLQMTITEVDLAGDFEPWRRASVQDVRIVKDIYPPRIDFSYKLTDASGAVIKEGKEKLRDLAFMTRMVIDRSDSLHFEKDLLRDWIRSTLRVSNK